MASVTTDIITNTASESLADRFVAILERLAQVSPTYRRLEKLSATSDADLAAQGLTRSDAVRDVFGGRYYA
jgi:hypothetical protein